MNELWAFGAGVVAGGGIFGYLFYHIGHAVGHSDAIRKVAEG